METHAYAAFQGSNELLDGEKIDMSDKESVDSGGSSLASKEDSPSPSQKKRLSFKGVALVVLNFGFKESYAHFLLAQEPMVHGRRNSMVNFQSTNYFFSCICIFQIPKESDYLSDQAVQKLFEVDCHSCINF